MFVTPWFLGSMYNLKYSVYTSILMGLHVVVKTITTEQQRYLLSAVKIIDEDK